MQIPPLGFSIYASVIATVSLGWNVYQFYNKKGRIRLQHSLNIVGENDWELKFTIFNLTDRTRFFNLIAINYNNKLYTTEVISPSIELPVQVESYVQYNYEVSIYTLKAIVNDGTQMKVKNNQVKL